MIVLPLAVLIAATGLRLEDASGVAADERRAIEEALVRVLAEETRDSVELGASGTRNERRVTYRIAGGVTRSLVIAELAIGGVVKTKSDVEIPRNTESHELEPYLRKLVLALAIPPLPALHSPSGERASLVPPLVRPARSHAAPIAFLAAGAAVTTAAIVLAVVASSAEDELASRVRPGSADTDTLISRAQKERTASLVLFAGGAALAGLAITFELTFD